MTKYKIVLVPFPFDDFSTTKVRPALCLTNPTGKFNHVVIAFISSRIPSDILETDIIIKKNDNSFQATGLRISSVVRIHKIVTIPKELIKRELGKLNKKFQKEVDRKLNKLFKN